MRVCAGRKSAFMSVHTDIGEQRHPWKWHSSCFQSHLDFLATVKKTTVHYNHCCRQHMTVTCITSQEFVSKSQKYFLYLSFCSLLPLDFLSSFYLLSVSIICNNSSLSFFQVKGSKICDSFSVFYGHMWPQSDHSATHHPSLVWSFKKHAGCCSNLKFSSINIKQNNKRL